MTKVIYRPVTDITTVLLKSLEVKKTVEAQNLEPDCHSTSTTLKGLSENLKKMSWHNPVSPIDVKNSIPFIVQFFWG